MGLYSYSHCVGDEKKVARAQAHDLNASYKDMTQVMAAIRGKPYVAAVAVLEDAISEKKAIRYKKFAKNLGHRSELGGRKGRYPKKEARMVLAMLKNAKANADSKGLDSEALRVASAAAYKQDMFMRYRRQFVGGAVIGYGRQSFASKYVTCWAELTLDEKAQRKAKKAKNEEGGKKKVEAKKEEHKTEGKKVHAAIAKQEVKMEEKKTELKKEEKKAQIASEGVKV